MLKPTFAIVLIVCGGAAAATALPQCLAQLHQAVANVGNPGSVESQGELETLTRRVSALRDIVGRLEQERESLATERDKIRSAERDRTYRLGQIEHRLSVVNDLIADVQRRRRINNDEARRQIAAHAGARTIEELSSAVTWARQINDRHRSLYREWSDLDRQKRDLEAQKSGIEWEVLNQAERFRWITHTAQRVDQETDAAIRECNALSSRALALRQIAGVQRSSSIRYPAEQATAGKLVDDLLKSAGADVATGAAPRLAAMARSTTAGFRSMAKFAKFAGAAFTAADLFADVTIAAMEPHEREVVRNIYLIGDYSYALRAMAAEQGVAAFRTAEYEAIRSELERLRSEMPGSNYDVIRQSLGSYDGMVEAFKAVASNYAGDKAGKTLASLRKYSGRERQTLGPAAVALFGGVLNSTGKVFVPQLAESAEKDIESFVGERQSDDLPAAAAYPATNSIMNPSLEEQ